MSEERVAERRKMEAKVIQIFVRQLDEEGKQIYGAPLLLDVEEDKTFRDLLKELIEGSNLSREIKDSLKQAIANPQGHTTVTFYIIDQQGEKRVINLDDNVLDIVRRYQPRYIFMDIARVVGTS